MELSVKERVVLPTLFPETSSKLKLQIMDSIIKKTAISPEEAQAIGYRERGEGHERIINWNDKKETVLNVEFTEIELSTIRECIDRLDKAEKLRPEQLPIIKKFEK